MNRFMLNLIWAACLSLLFCRAEAQQPYAFTNFAGLPGTLGATDGLLNEARFNQPAGLVVDADGNLLVADVGNHTIRRISTNGMVSILAGAVGQSGFLDGSVTEARFNQPYFLALDTAGDLYVTELINHTVRKITKAGVVSTFAGGSGQFNRPAGLAFDPAGNLYVADTANHVIRLVTPGGLVLTLAGVPGNGGSNDGPAATARFYFPSDLTVDAQGNIYVSDSGNDTIRKISALGAVTTLAGAPLQKAGTDGTGSAARFYQPYGIRLDASGNLVIADSGNSAIRRVTPEGAVTTIGGLAGQIGTVNGIGDAARFYNPASVAFDATGTLFVSDPFNHRISRATVVAGFPQITGEPASLTFGSAGTTLTVTATGSAPLTYQWRLNGTNLPNATNATLAVAGFAANAGSYRVVVANSVGSVTSSEALLSFLEGPRFYASVSLSGILGRQYRVDVAEILNATTNWLTLTNLTLTTNPTTVIDPASAGVSNRYYRAVLLP
ncbi:MAG: hypothetical protein RLZZ265_2965 [Verrucomicrobiota bacterium]